MKESISVTLTLGLLLSPFAIRAQAPGFSVSDTPNGLFLRCMTPMQRVTGSPYSIQREWREDRTRPNGSHSITTMTTRLYRDSEGRTREERFIPMREGAPEEPKPKNTVILDPVKGIGFVFNLRGHVAVRTVCEPAMPRPPQALSTQQQMAIEKLSRVPPPNKESLGTQMMEGMLVTGERETAPYPAGSAGNDKPFKSITERWFSPELQMNILVTSSDPRTGETIDQITKLDRSEPDASLFLPPSDYVVQDK
jgi:hypothetical protein